MNYTHLMYSRVLGTLAYKYDLVEDVLYLPDDTKFINRTCIEFDWFREQFKVVEVNFSLDNE